MIVRVPLVPRDKKPLVYAWSSLPPESPVWARVAASVPDCNWGIRLDDLLVADCDSAEAAMWWRDNCPVGTGWVSRGARDRRGFWYARPADTHLRTCRLRPDLEIRTGSGAQQVAPPSIHPSGRRYEWCGPEGEVVDPAALPIAPEIWIMEQAPRDEVWAEGGGDGWDFIPEGHRDTALTSMAGQLRRHGASRAFIFTAIEALNDLGCRPPLSEEDLQRISRSVSRYDPADVVTEWLENELAEALSADDGAA